MIHSYAVMSGEAVICPTLPSSVFRCFPFGSMLQYLAEVVAGGENLNLWIRSFLNSELVVV